MKNYQKEFTDFGKTTYLDCATQGPFPKVTAERIGQAIELKNRPERLRDQDYFELPQRVRGLIARLVGAQPDEIALTNSATQGLSVVANGLDMRSGDQVIVSEGNFPSNLFTWLHLRRQGIEVTLLRPRRGFPAPEEVAEALTPRTRVVALDYVSYINGSKMDLSTIGKILSGRDILLVVDATQAVGAIPFSSTRLPADVFVCAAYKWLLGPYGTGFAFLRASVQDRLKPMTINWMSVGGASHFPNLPKDDFTLTRGARVFDVPETANFLNLHALEASLEFLLRVGVETVTRHCYRLLDRLATHLRSSSFELNASAEPAHRSTILTFRASSADTTERLYRTLRDQDLIVSLRHGWIRVSPHLYNSTEDVDRLAMVAGDSGSRVRTSSRRKA